MDLWHWKDGHLQPAQKIRGDTDRNRSFSALLFLDTYEFRQVSDKASMQMARRLVREEGLLVGGSAGTAVVAAVRVAARGGLSGPVITVLPDAWDRYRAQPWMQGWPPGWLRISQACQVMGWVMPSPMAFENASLAEKRVPR